MLTGPEAGITRDSISVDFSWKKKPVTIFDTAGMRKKSKIIQKLEKISVNDTLKAIRFADLVLLIIDSTLPFENQDLRIASLTEREGRALIVVLNKIDLIKNKDEFYDKMCKKIDFILPKVKGTPVVVTSAIKFEGLDALYEKVTYVESIWNKRVSTSKLNEWLIFTCQKHPPPAIKGKRIKLIEISTYSRREAFNAELNLKLTADTSMSAVQQFLCHFRLWVLENCFGLAVFNNLAVIKYHELVADVAHQT